MKNFKIRFKQHAPKKIMTNLNNWLLSRIDIQTVKTQIYLNRYWLFYLLCIGLLTFSYEMFNFSLSIDEEFNSFIQTPKLRLIAIGRWGLYFLNYFLLPNPVLPFIPILITALFYSATFFVFCRLFTTTPDAACYFAAPIFIACPTHFHLISFIFMSYGTGIGFFCSVLATLIIIKSDKKFKLIPVFLIGFSIGLYQAFALVPPIVFTFYLLHSILSFRHRQIGSYIKEGIRFAIVFVGGGLLYWLISKLCILSVGINTDHYLQNTFVKISTHWDYWYETLIKTFLSMGYYYSGACYKIYGTGINPISPGFLVTLSTLVLFILLFRTSNKLIFIGFGIIVLSTCIFFPFSMNLVNKGVVPTRVLLAFPIAVSGLLLISYKFSPPLVRIGLGLAAVFCTFQFLVINTRISYSEYMTWQADRELALRIQTRLDTMFDQLPPKTPIYSLEDGQVVQGWRVELVGQHKLQPNMVYYQDGMIGSSFFSMGDVHRVLAFMRTMGLHQYIGPTLNTRRSLMKSTESMSVWPAENSIKVIDGIIVIKLSEYTPNQLNKLCEVKKNDCVQCKIITRTNLDDGVKIIEAGEEFPQADWPEPLYELKLREKNYASIQPEIILDKESMESIQLSKPTRLVLPDLPLKNNEDYYLSIHISATGNSTLKLHYVDNSLPPKLGPNKIKQTIHTIKLKLMKGDNSFNLELPGKYLKNGFRCHVGTVGCKYEISDISIYHQVKGMK